MVLSDKFISAGEKYSTFLKRVPAPIFRKNISLSDKGPKGGNYSLRSRLLRNVSQWRKYYQRQTLSLYH